MMMYCQENIFELIFKYAVYKRDTCTMLQIIPLNIYNIKDALLIMVIFTYLENPY